MSKIKKYGWNKYFQDELDKIETPFIPARIISQHSNLYKVITDKGEYLAEKSGKLEYFAENEKELPVIGDWVLVDIFDQENKAVIHEIIPRKTSFSRKKAGKSFEEQVIAANTDLVFIITGLDHNYNLSRLERYLSIIDKTKIKPALIFNKTDLIRSTKKIQKEVKERIPDIEQLFVSAKKKRGFDDLYPLLKKGKTVCFLGSSGVGKSSIINILMDKEVIKVQEVRQIDSKGRHTTSSKQMFLLPSGSIVIDTPGIREFGLIGDKEENINEAFPDILELAKYCRFRDCSHEVEPDCAVRDALIKNELQESRYNSYIKLKKEIQYTQQKQQEKGKSSNPKKRWKDLSKKIKTIRKKYQ